jgi:hypothetical protein
MVIGYITMFANFLTTFAGLSTFSQMFSPFLLASSTFSQMFSPFLLASSKTTFPPFRFSADRAMFVTTHLAKVGHVPSIHADLWHNVFFFRWPQKQNMLVGWCSSVQPINIY